MDKLKLFIVNTLCVSSFAIVANAKNNFDISASYGYAITNKISIAVDENIHVNTRPKNIGIFNIAAGYFLKDNIRAELAYTGFYNLKAKAAIASINDDNHILSERYSHKMNINALFVNVNAYIAKINDIRASIVGGVGISRNSAKPAKLEIFNHSTNEKEDVLGESNKKNSFAWNIGLEMEKPINDKSALTIGYKYYSFGKSDMSEKKLNAQAISFGFRLKV